MKNEVNCKIHNRFDIEVIDGKTGEVKQKAKAFNIVTNKLWEYLITTTTPFAQYIQYGTGTGTPSASDTSLFSRANAIGVTHVSYATDFVQKVATRVVRIQLGLTTSNGITISEVGLGATAYDGGLTTHAMLQDMNGNPITIAKTETDIINIYATIYCHWTVSNSVIFYPKNGFYETILGAANVLGSLTMGVNNRTYQGSNSKTWSKNANLAQKKIVYTAPRFSETEANMNGIMYLQGMNSYDGLAIKCGTDSWSKFSITNESVGTGDGTTINFRTKFGLPENATVKINGVTQSSGVTVKKIPANDIAVVMPVDVNASDVSNNRIVFAPYFGTANGVPVYNMFWQETGLSGVYVTASSSYTSGTMYASNDLVNWTAIASGERVSYITTHFNVPEAYKNYKFFRCNFSNDGGYAYSYHTDNPANIVFDTAPQEGDVITIDYETECIPKDSDHVFDATVTFSFGDYVA